MCSVLRPRQMNSVTMYVSSQSISHTVDHLSMWVYGSELQMMSLKQQMEMSKASLNHDLGQPSNMGA